MTYSHYPSLELCQKLTEIGFPESYYSMAHNGSEIMVGQNGAWVCPSVMEMLDIIPSIIYDEDNNAFYPEFWIRGCHYRGIEDIIKSISSDTTPNAIAEMILWLNENNFISFTK